MWYSRLLCIAVVTALISKLCVEAFTLSSRGLSFPRNSLRHIGGWSRHDASRGLHFHAVDADISVGSQVVGEVYDHDNNGADPRIYFHVKGDAGGKKTIGYMPVHNLNWQERMSLHVGAVINAFVVDKTGEELKLSLNSPDDLSSQQSSRNRNDDDNGKGGSMVRKGNGAGTVKIPTRGGGQLNNNGEVRGIASNQVLLNNLKTGMTLEGEIASCTQYAAFVNAGVVRVGKAGTFVPVNGMLHQNDMPADAMITRSNHRGASKHHYNRRDSEYEDMQEEDRSAIYKGKRVTVYVKEVYKNSGRITYTLNPAINKAQILAEREKTKSDGNERRRARRLRRILEDISVGDTVTGTVDRVINEGVLVSFSGFGPLPVVGLLSKRDLPREFQIPPDLKDSFQKQLLEQDFPPGREVTCGVYRINNKANNSFRMKYNLKLTFEEFGAMPSDGLDIPDSAIGPFGTTTKRVAGVVPKEDEKEDEEAQEEEDEAWEDDDTREIYDELRGTKTILTAQDLFDWADIQDMISDGDISVNQLNEAVREVAGKLPSGKTDVKLSFSQFAEVISILQDAMNGPSGLRNSSNDDELRKYLQVDDDDNEDDDDDEVLSGDTISASLYDEEGNNDTDFYEVGDFDESLLDGIEDEAVEEVAKEIFDSLRGKKSTLDFKSVRAWGDIEEMIASGYISEADLKEVWQTLNSDSIGFDQFFILVQMLEDIAAENEEGVLDGGHDNTDEEYDELDEEAEAEMLGEIFETLAKDKQTITVTELRKWDELKALSLEKEELVNLLKEAGIKVDARGSVRGGIDQEQFIAFVRTLDVAEEIDEDGNGATDVDNDEDEDEDLDIGDYIYDEDDSPLTEEENREIIEGLFAQLRGSSKGVSVASFMKWEDVNDLVKEGLLEEETILALLSESGVDLINSKKALMTLSQFSDAVTMLDQTLEALEGEVSDSSDIDVQYVEDEYGDDQNEGGGEEEGEEEEELSEEQMARLARDIFDELRGNAKSLPVKRFKKWEEVQELIDAGAVQEATIDTLIRAVTGGEKTSVLSFEHFQQLVSLLDEAGETAFTNNGDDGAVISTEDGYSKYEDEDGEEYEPSPEEIDAISRDIFDELKSAKSGKVPVKKFRGWSSIKEVLQTGELSQWSLDRAIEAVDSDRAGSLDFAQFKSLMEKVEDAMDDDDDEAVEVATSAGRGFAKASIDAVQSATHRAAAEDAQLEGDDDAVTMARVIFDELRGRKTTLSVATFKDWQDVQDMLTKKQLKLSTLERAISKVGALDSGEMTFSQFSQVIDSIQKDVDQADLMRELGREDNSDTMPPSITTSRKAGTVMVVEGGDEDEYGDVDEDSGDHQGNFEDMDPEEEIGAIYDELRGDSDSLPLVEFLKWEDVQELLEVGAVSKDTLAECIENVGLTVEDGNLSEEQFRDLVQLLDEIVDQSKLLLDEDDFDDESDLEDHGDDDGGGGDDDDDDDDDFSALLDDDDEEREAQEVREMFHDLSKGKGVITLKQLRTWDELQELVDAGLCSKATIEEYISRLGLTAEDNAGVTFDKFTEFIGYLDHVLLDEGGFDQKEEE